MPYANVSGGGVVLTFPDVCKTPSPAGGVPIPYPATATKARQARSARKGTPPATGTMSAMGRKTSATGLHGSLVGLSARGRTSFMKAGAPDAIAEGEAAVLRSRLGTLGNQLKSMNSANPADWQSLLEEYLVTAGALFVTLHG